jgi:hypothetical protein
MTSYLGLDRCDSAELRVRLAGGACIPFPGAGDGALGAECLAALRVTRLLLFLLGCSALLLASPAHAEDGLGAISEAARG